MAKEILIRVGEDTIYLTIDGKAGTIRSSFRDGAIDEVPEVDGLEAVVLGHACAGVDVESPAYVEGLQTALEAIANHS